MTVCGDNFPNHLPSFPFFNDYRGIPGAWIGMRRQKKEEVFKWMDPMDANTQYRNWAADYLDDSNRGNCVVGTGFDPGLKQWVATSCDEYHFGFVCQYQMRGTIFMFEQ